MAGSGGQVDFDFEGSLRLARRLWSAAAALEHEDSQRENEFVTAKAKWRGSHGDDFVARRDTERSDASRVVAALRADAHRWAVAWAGAMDQQNKNNRIAAVEAEADRRSSERGNLEKLGDLTPFSSDDSLKEAEAAIRNVVPVTPPTDPGFAPTTQLMRF